jgi:hypothetical protein
MRGIFKDLVKGMPPEPHNEPKIALDSTSAKLSRDCRIAQSKSAIIRSSFAGMADKSTYSASILSNS